MAVKSITSKNARVRFAGEKIAHSARGAQGEKILRRTDTSYVNAVKYGQAARKTTFQLEPLRRKNAQKTTDAKIVRAKSSLILNNPDCKIDCKSKVRRCQCAKCPTAVFSNRKN